MPNLVTDLVLILKEGDNHDFVLVCEGGEQVKVHKLILSARSLVFKRMTEVDMQEKNTGTIKIKDFEPGVVKEFISYLYSDQISADFSELAELMRIGHLYEVFNLVDLCSIRLVHEVSLDNVAKLGTLAETLEDLDLSEKCAKVVADNFEQLDNETIDSLPPSLLKKSFAKSRSKMMSEVASSVQIVDQSNLYIANFLTNHSVPTLVKNNGTIQTSFYVSRGQLWLTGCGLYIDGSPQIELSIYKRQDSMLLSMTTTVTSTDSSKPKKIIFPAPVTVVPDGHWYDVKITFKEACIHFLGESIISPLSLPSLSLPMKNGEVKVIFNNRAEVPVLYLEE